MSESRPLRMLGYFGFSTAEVDPWTSSDFSQDTNGRRLPDRCPRSAPARARVGSSKPSDEEVVVPTFPSPRHWDEIGFTCSTSLAAVSLKAILVLGFSTSIQSIPKAWQYF